MIEIRDGEIRCDREALPKQLNITDWIPFKTATGKEAFRADTYRDPDAGPGQVRSIFAEATEVKGAWHMRLRATVVDDVGQVHSGTIGKHYRELTSASSAKMQATRNVHRFARGDGVPFAPDVPDGAWQPGDWIIDADGKVWVRASDADAAAGRAWGKPPAAARRQTGNRSTVAIPAGRVGDDDVALPVVLLIRDGFPVQT